MAFIRTTFYILVLLLVIAGLAIIGVALLIDPNKIKPIIINEVKKETGYNLSIYGNVTWSLYPLLGIKIDRMTLSVPTQTRPFADLYGITLATELKELMHGREKLLGNLYISQAEFLNIRAQKVTVRIEWLDKLIAMPVTASLYDGWLEGVVRGDFIASYPRWSWGMQLTHVQLQPLLLDMNGNKSKLIISGRAQVKSEGSTYGLGQQELLSHLNAKMQYGVSNGAVSGVDLNYLLQTADALISRKPVTTAPVQQQTVFESLTGTGAIRSGVFNTHDTVLISTNFTARAAGNIDLINELIDFELSVAPVHLEKLKYPIPVDIAGSLSHPAINLDTLKMNTIITTEQVEKLKLKVKDEMKKIPGKIDNFISKVLNK